MLYLFHNYFKYYNNNTLFKMTYFLFLCHPYEITFKEECECKVVSIICTCGNVLSVFLSKWFRGWWIVPFLGMTVEVCVTLCFILACWILCTWSFILHRIWPRKYTIYLYENKSVWVFGNVIIWCGWSI